jgi:hypothetical protein
VFLADNQCLVIFIIEFRLDYFSLGNLIYNSLYVDFIVLPEGKVIPRKDILYANPFHLPDQ